MTRYTYICLLLYFCLFPLISIAKEKTESQEDFLHKNSEYIISDTINLGGKEIEIPNNVTVIFKKNSCIRNGSIKFNDTKLINPHFLDCKYTGEIRVNGEIVDSVFCKNQIYDQDVLWWLIEQAANNSTTLEITKDYTISTSRIYSPPYEQDQRSYVIIEDKSFKIKGNRHTIYDRHEHKGHFCKDFIVLVGCHNVEIESLYFEGLHNEINNIAKKGATYFPAPGGTNVILCLGDTNDITIIDGKCRHCFSYIWCGGDPKVSIDFPNRNHYNDNFVIKGFENMDLEIDAFDTQYPIAIYKGRNIKVRLNFLYARRGCRLQGVKKADVKINGAFATTPVMLLLKDGISYSDKKFSNRVYNECSDINADIRRIDVKDTITQYRWYDIALNIGCYNGLDSLATAQQFKDRLTPYSFRNINVTYSCDVQQYAVLLSRNRIRSLNDLFELKIMNSNGGGITDAYIVNQYSQLNLNISKSNLKKVSMNFNSQDKISIFDSIIQIFQNNMASEPQIMIKRSKITFED